MMNTQIKISAMSALFLFMALFSMSSVLAVQSDEQMQHRIASEVAKSSQLQDIHLEIHVQPIHANAGLWCLLERFGSMSRN